VANQQKINGFTPVKYLNGADWDGRGNLYHIDSGDTNGYYVGDIVALKAGTETISGESVGLQTLTVGATTGTNIGVILAIGTVARGGPYINANNLTQTYRPSSATVPYYALVSDDPNVVYMATEYTSSAGSAFTVAATSKNAVFSLGTVTIPANGSPLSAAFIDHNTAAATTSTYPIKLLGLAQVIDPSSVAYNTFGNYAKWLCILNNHYFRTGVAGV
jgi:hypothetical protein